MIKVLTTQRRRGPTEHRRHGHRCEVRRRTAVARSSLQDDADRGALVRPHDGHRGVLDPEGRRPRLPPAPRSCGSSPPTSRRARTSAHRGTMAMPNTNFLGIAVRRPCNGRWSRGSRRPRASCVPARRGSSVAASSPAPISSVGFFDGKRQIARVKKNDAGHVPARPGSTGRRQDGRARAHGRRVGHGRAASRGRPAPSASAIAERHACGSRSSQAARSGIGAAVARLLTSRGWRCVLVARGEAELAATARELDAEAGGLRRRRPRLPSTGSPRR